LAILALISERRREGTSQSRETLCVIAPKLETEKPKLIDSRNWKTKYWKAENWNLKSKNLKAGF